MTQKFIPFAKPDIGEAEIEEVVATLRSGWVTTGPKVKLFEQAFVDYLSSHHAGNPPLEALAVNSATAGLHLALEALGVTQGDEVIVPSYTFTASAEVVRYLGATPVFVDVEESSFNIDCDAIVAAITPRTRVIMPVHFAGLACDMNRIIQIAQDHNVKVVEDAAHALPSSSGGALIGTHDSDAVVYSFYANKTMTTGEGGMLVTRHPEVAERARIMRLHGISKDAFDRYSSTKPAWYYEVVAPGFKYNMTDIAASLGIHQLERLTRFQEIRESMAQRYNALLAGLPLILPCNPDEGELHARHLYPVRLQPECRIDRDQFIQAMADKGVGCSVHFIPLHRQPYWKDTFGLTPGQFPVADRLFEQEVTLPLYTAMTDADQVRVADAVRSVLEMQV